MTADSIAFLTAGTKALMSPVGPIWEHFIADPCLWVGFLPRALHSVACFAAKGKDRGFLGTTHSSSPLFPRVTSKELGGIGHV